MDAVNQVHLVHEEKKALAEDPPRELTKEDIDGIKHPPMPEEDAEQEVAHIETTLRENYVDLRKPSFMLRAVRVELQLISQTPSGIDFVTTASSQKIRNMLKKTTSAKFLMQPMTVSNQRRWNGLKALQMNQVVMMRKTMQKRGKSDENNAGEGDNEAKGEERKERKRKRRRRRNIRGHWMKMKGKKANRVGGRSHSYGI